MDEATKIPVADGRYEGPDGAAIVEGGRWVGFVLRVGEWAPDPLLQARSYRVRRLQFLNAASEALYQETQRAQQHEEAHTPEGLRLLALHADLKELIEARAAADQAECEAALAAAAAAQIQQEDLFNLEVGGGGAKDPGAPQNTEHR